MNARAEPSPTPQPGEPHPALLRAVAGLLRPLVKVLIARGIGFPAFMRLAKSVYVEVADHDFPVEGKAQTDSRIHLLTGIHRKDIRSLRAANRPDKTAPPPVSRDARMIALWTGAPGYLDGSGAPRPLPRQRASDGSPSFEGLAETVSKDIRARAVLDEWLRRDLVRIDDTGLVHLNANALAPREDFAELAYYFGRNLRDHAGASAHNLLGGSPPMLERAVYYEALTPASADELAIMARTLGAEALVRVNRKAFELSQQDADKPGAEQRISFGVYFYAGPDDEADGEGGAA